MKILEFEKISGLTRDTIRYYERIGLLPKPNRGENGYRQYTERHLTILGFITRGKAIGFSLKEIQRGLERYLSQGQICPEFKQELEAKKRFFNERIQEDKAAVLHINKMLESD